MSTLSTQRRGEAYILAETFLWSFFPIVTIMTIKHLSPIFSLSISSVFALIFFALTLTLKKKWHELFIKKARKDILLSSLFIMLLYIFLFLGLEHTTATNGAVILFLQILFSFLFFNVLKKEPITRLQILGAFLMAGGAVIILTKAKGLDLNKGDILVLMAAMVAPVANYYQQRTRRNVGAHSLLFVRTLLSIPLLFALAFWLDSAPDLNDISAVLWLLFINGFLLLGLSKIFWIEAIHRISVTKAGAMTALGPVYTMGFAYFLLHEVPTPAQMLGVVPVILGGVLIVLYKQKS
ncbi:MAG: DMT family transporter [Campylobacterota bacterium]